MMIKKKPIITTIIALAILATTGATAMLNVQVANVGSVVGQTKELTVSSAVITGAQILGTTVFLPPCLGALATSFADVATATINWGASLQSNTDYEIWFCLGNIGSSAGTVRVSTTGQTAGETEIFEQAQAGLLGTTFTSCDGAVIQGAGVIAVRGHLHTPSVGLNGQVALTGKTTFNFS